MRSLLHLPALYVLFASCNISTANTTKDRTATVSELPAVSERYNADSIPLQVTAFSKKAYNAIVYDTVEVLKAAPGTKSVLFNSMGNRLYAMNLEGMSIYEFDQPTRKITREFKFTPTAATGWDYEKDEPIPSFEEKPVEACLSHDDRILWVSLHNAAGIVPIRVDTIQANLSVPVTQHDKKVTVSYPDSAAVDSFYIPIIKTGKTPKIVSRTSDSRHLLVSNWHSYNVSVLETNLSEYPFAKSVARVAVPSIPRGIAVDDKNNRSFVAIMGGSSIDVINNSVWMKEKTIEVASNPRHIVMDTANHIFVSYNRLGRIACLDANTGKTLFSTKTAAQPRTIMLSKNQKFLFVTCYSSDTVQVFKIKDQGFEKVVSLPCKGHPVGVDIFENDDRLEAWVCSYNRGAISIFSFNKK